MTTQWYRNTGFLATPIPASPTIDPNSTAMITALAGNSSFKNAFCFPNGSASVSGGGSTTVYVVDQAFATAHHATFSTDFQGNITFPFNSATQVTSSPGLGNDEHITFIMSGAVTIGTTSYNDGDALEFQAFDPGTTHAHSYSITNTKTGDASSASATPLGDTAGMMEFLAGLIRPEEVLDVFNGVIDHIPHPLAIIAPNGVVSTAHRFPAVHSDGTGSATLTIPSGGLIQMIPGTSLAGLSTWNTMIAKTLILYGAYIRDCGGSGASWLQSVSDSVTSYAITPDTMPSTIFTTSNFRVIASAPTGGALTGYAAAVMVDNPVVYARLGESSGTAAADTSSNGNTGTYHGSPTLGTTGLVGGGDPDTAVTLAAGSSQYAQFPHIAAYAVGDVCSIEASFKTTDAGVLALGSFGHTAGNNGSLYLRLNAGVIEILSSNSAVLGGSAATYNNGVKHHAIVTKTGATVKLYVDGADVTPTITNTTLGTSSEPFTVGGDTSSGTVFEPYTGIVDEVSGYATALSSTRALAHYVAWAGSTTWTSGAAFGITDNRTAVGKLTAKTGMALAITDGRTAAGKLTAKTGMSLVITDSRTMAGKLTAKGQFTMGPVFGFVLGGVDTNAGTTGMFVLVTPINTFAIPKVNVIGTGFKVTFTDHTGAPITTAFSFLAVPVI